MENFLEPKKLEDLLKIVKQNYQFHKVHNQENHTLTLLEKKYYISLINTNTLKHFFETIENLQDNYLIDEINEMFTLKDYSFEKIVFNTKNIHYQNTSPQTQDTLSEKLYVSLKLSYLLTYLIEEKIRNIFLELLNNHIKASLNMSDIYLCTLTKFKRNVEFKYSKVLENDSIIEEYIHANIKNYDYTTFINNYLDSLVEKTIANILNIDDTLYEDDKYYAKGIAYQILLRSIFIIINDYNRLASYEEFINNKNESIGKSIIRTAFIANYNDLKNYNKRKVMETQ